MKKFEYDGATIRYRDTRPDDTAAPMLLLTHGFPLSHAMWKAQLEGLAADCRIVAPDLRGYGASTLGGWPAADEPPTLDRYADDLLALVGNLAPTGPLALVGFSMGGYIALALERTQPNFFDALVLMDTRAVADSEEAIATRLKMAVHVHEWGAARVAELMRPKLFAPDAPAAVVAETVGVISSTDPAAIAASQRAMAARPDSTGLLAGIAKPCLVLVGEHDAISPPDEMRTIADSITGAKFVEVPGAGHMAPIERPDAVNAALREFVTAL